MRCWTPQGGSRHFGFRMCPGVGFRICPGVGDSSRAVAGLLLRSPASSQSPGAATLTHHTAGTRGMSATPGRGRIAWPRGVHGVSTRPAESHGSPLFALVWGLPQGSPGWGGERPRAPLPGSHLQIQALLSQALSGWCLVPLRLGGR